MRRVICLSLLLLSNAPNAADRLPLAAYNYPMLMSESTITGKGHGFVIDIVIAAASAAQFNAAIDYFPTKRALLQGRTAAYAGSIGAVEQFSAAELREIDVVEITPMPLSLFYLHSNNKLPKEYRNLEELRAFQLSAVLGSAALPMFKQAGVPHETSDEIDNCFGKLQRQRVDICAAVDIAAWDAINRLFPLDAAAFARYERPLLTYRLSLNFNHHYRDVSTLLRRFSLGLATIKQNGVYADIVKRYYGNNAPGELTPK